MKHIRLILLIVMVALLLPSSSTAHLYAKRKPVAASGSVTITNIASSTMKNGDTGIVISGSGFGASQGVGNVRIGHTNDDLYTTSFYPTYRSISTVATVASGNLTNTAPAGAAQNDIYICFISSRSNVVWTIPTGGEWTLVAQDSSGNNSTTTNTAIASGAAYWCRRGAVDPNFVWTRSGGDVASSYVVCYYGCITNGSPIDTFSISNAQANATTLTTPGLTSTVRNTRLVMGFCGAVATSASQWYGATGPYSLIKRVDANTATGSGTTLSIADWVWSTALATGTLQNTAVASSRHTVIALLLKPLVYAPIAQTVTAWGNTSITFTVVRTNGLDRGTRYVFVENNASQTNASGYAITMTGVVKYVNPASAAGGDGSTTNLSGGTAAYTNVTEALYKSPLNYTDIREVHCVGNSVDVTNIDHGPLFGSYINTTRDNYLYLEGNNTSGIWNTNAYRISTTNTSGIYNNGPCHVRVKNFQIECVSTTSGNLQAYRLSTVNITAMDCDVRFDSCIAKCLKSGGTGNVTGFGNSGFGGDGVAYAINCISQGANGTQHFTTATLFDQFAHINCVAYGGTYGFVDYGVAINCLSVSNSADFIASTAYQCRNNASSDGTAIGVNTRTGGPSFVSTSGTYDLHLQVGDTVAKDFGLSDPGFGLFNYDIDGVAVTGSWSIGVDDP